MPVDMAETLPVLRWISNGELNIHVVKAFEARADDGQVLTIVNMLGLSCL